MVPIIVIVIVFLLIVIVTKAIELWVRSGDDSNS